MSAKIFINERLAAYLLLSMFVIFSIQMPLLSSETIENNNKTEKALIVLGERLAANKNYCAAPTVKFDLGQYRSTVSLYFLKFLNWSLLAINREHGITNRLSSVSISSVPVYITVRVLRN